MDKLVIEGGRALKGDVRVSGSKNATLPILAATLLTDEKCVIKNIPKLRDTLTMMKLLKTLGKNVEFNNGTAVITAKKEASHIADYKLVSTMRGSFCVLGPILTKLGKAKVSLPGGCVIGIRPVDLHIKGLKALGAKIEVEAGYVLAHCKKRLKGGLVYLGGVFGSSVLATENILMAATLAQGETTIESAACEPEIDELARFLIAMGADIKGHGSPRITIRGVRKLKGAEFTIGPDRIEAGTYMIMAAATHSTITLHNVEYSQLLVVIDTLQNMGVKFTRHKNAITVKPPRVLQATSLTTLPYPGFPTDLQAQFTAMMAIIPGVSLITDKVFPDRFMHIAELNRMGAEIRRDGNTAIIDGVKKLYGAPVMASDLRASAALVIAGLIAKGRTEILRIYHLERGYEDLESKLIGLGAKIYREKE